MSRNIDYDEDEYVATQASLGRPDADRTYEQDEEEGIQMESPVSPSDNLAHSHIFHRDTDLVDRYHGISSPFALCSRLYLRTLAAAKPTEFNDLLVLLRDLRETASGTEPFPQCNDNFPTQLPPKQQAIAAVHYYFKHIDCTTDIFVQRNLLSNFERVYSQPHRPRDYVVERAKVLRLLYVRDKSLCITRGSVLWMTSYECKITTQLKVAVERQVPYSSHIQLAMIQDELYHMTGAFSEFRRASISKASQLKPKSIKQQLDQLATDHTLLSSHSASILPHDALIAMEFLSTRIVAQILDLDTRQTESLKSDARANCLLLLISYGDRNPSVVEAYHSSTSTTVSPTNKHSSPTSETNNKTFTNLLDTFSVPAFFILFERLAFQKIKSDIDMKSNTDWELLRKVSSCYTKGSSQMPPQSYHSRWPGYSID